jgi:hypothetical protein
MSETLTEDRPGTKVRVLGVSIITPVGAYPLDGGLARAKEDERIEHVLKQAAAALGITDTTDWVAKVDGRKIDPHHTFSEEDLKCVVDIDWHQHGGGGGASGAR